MLPQSTDPPNVVKVFLNPKFKNVHVNPKFIQKNSSSALLDNQQPIIGVAGSSNSVTIHVNPRFLEARRRNEIPVPSIETTESEIVLAKVPTLESNRRLVRNVNIPRPHINRPATKPSPSLVKIGQRKLVRRSLFENSTKSLEKPKFPDDKTKYKLDRRIFKRSISGSQTVVTKYRFRKVLGNENLVPTRVSSLELRKLSEKSPIVNKVRLKSGLLSINGVVYKSTPNKLQKSNVATTNKENSHSGDRMLIIRGEKFHLDNSGKRLRKSDNSLNASAIRRIDIGGLTYVAKDGKGTLERTNFHIARNHLTQAKQKSINILTNKYKKSNVPCLIYRRFGKCMALERGKCNKLHNPDQIAVCPNFLKGVCIKEDCLLSHKTCLSKMPVCKYYLDGCCTNESCPYLHKKVSRKAEICPEFEKGFCPLAERCPKRHEKPEKNRKREFKKRKPSSVPLDPSDKRYYLDKDASESKSSPSTEPYLTIVPKRPQNLSALPSFIPIG